MNSKDEKTEKFIYAARIGQHLAGVLGPSRMPFLPRKAQELFLENLGRRLGSLIEEMTGVPLFVEAPAAPLDRIPRKFHPLIIRAIREGIITQCGRPITIGGWPHIPGFTFKASFGTIASGHDLDEDTAAAKALAELFERHSLGVYDPRDFIVGSWHELRDRGAIDPLLFSSFSKTQLDADDYARHRITDDSLFMWAKCISLNDGRTHLIPAQLVYFRYQHLPNEPQIRQGTTNGAAAGNSWEMAAYNAICENVERDAFMIHWLNRIAPPKFDLIRLKNSGNQRIGRLLNIYEKYKIPLYLLDITTDIGVPVVLALIRESSPERPAAFVSIRADMDIEEAITAALTDGLRAGTWPDVTIQKLEEARKKLPNVTTIQERHIYWGQRELASEAAFLADGPTRNSDAMPTRLKNKFKTLEKIMAERGFTIFFADATSSIARSAGLTVLMSIIPGLYPLYLNEHFKYLGIKRLYDAPVKMGVFKESKREDEMNPVPHPML